jgi:regulator of protease activity HflC (stomatin/prohibitin superfamily)
MREGNMVKCGIGLQTWVMPWDQTVTFPSLINEVNFSAQQVTAEMQGVEVRGNIIWSVYRDGDGPFRCYKMFGSALKNRNPRSINDKLGDMAISIVRDRVANMSLDDILKNRNKLRNGVKEEVQKLLTGWGIWLETVEIQDVKILSSSLFRNLQTEFREKSRIDAERISASIQKEITEEELTRNLKR